METVAADPQWVETFMSISKEEIDSPAKISKYFNSDAAITKVHEAINGNQNNHHNITDEFILQQRIKHDKKISKQREMRMARLDTHLVVYPKLETICGDWRNDFIDSGFTTYTFRDYTNKCHKNDPDDLKYMINLCGCNLTKLNIYGYAYSDIMPLIKNNCTNLEQLTLIFKEIESKDFEDVFSNMSHLKRLTIYWKCEDPTLPMALVESIEQVCETLTTFVISCESKQVYPFGLPDSSIEIFSQANEALMTTVGNMKNLKHLKIRWAYGVTDEFLINLVDNAKNLKHLCISGSRITDEGIIALNKLNKLESFSLDATQSRKENKLITDESIKGLLSKTIVNFDISKCIQVTNDSVIELVKHLPNILTLDVRYTQVDLSGILEIATCVKNRKHMLTIYTSFEINGDIVQILRRSNVVCKYVIVTDYLDED
ncbi:uncharacterized protein LOC122854029 [Aphidius gifuensis]|uniref:uncharacterized protein LOC122854029 n=1 Tax=Aphidius gifuensis TaxID=684658 RepID=UPI001CDCAC9E|nr:uncharacterized protein LOC122854029 [Aphidius gifuensis]